MWSFGPTATQNGILLSTVSEFESMTGFGVKASVTGKHVEIGADRYMVELGYDVAAWWLKPICLRVYSI